MLSDYYKFIILFYFILFIPVTQAHIEAKGFVIASLKWPRLTKYLNKSAVVYMHANY